MTSRPPRMPPDSSAIGTRAHGSRELEDVHNSRGHGDRRHDEPEPALRRLSRNRVSARSCVECSGPMINETNGLASAQARSRRGSVMRPRIRSVLTVLRSEDPIVALDPQPRPTRRRIQRSEFLGGLSARRLRDPAATLRRTQARSDDGAGRARCRRRASSNSTSSPGFSPDRSRIALGTVIWPWLVMRARGRFSHHAL